MRRYFLLAALALLTLAPSKARAQGSLRIEAQPVYQSEGRDPIVFNSTCTAGFWNLVISSDTASRSTLMVAVASNTATVCLVPTVASSSATALSGANFSGCFPYTPGVELPAQVSSVTDYSHAAWWCRSVAGTQNIKGYRTRDRGDQGQASQLGLQ